MFKISPNMSPTPTVAVGDCVHALTSGGRFVQTYTVGLLYLIENKGMGNIKQNRGGGGTASFWFA